MRKFLSETLKNKSLLILGFGKEGQSTYNLIRNYFPKLEISIADRNERNQTALQIDESDSNTTIFLGKDYRTTIHKFNFIIKSPGLKIELEDLEPNSELSSQTELFLKAYKEQTVGVTGTKGKSTTSSLIFSILRNAKIPTFLVGNIGTPPFSIIDKISPESVIIFELSSHQLQFANTSPHIALLLNLFPEHLDHYKDFEAYSKAKFNIGLYQNSQDIFICHESLINHKQLSTKASIKYFSENNAESNCTLKGDLIGVKTHFGFTPVMSTKEIKNLRGAHNILNIMAAIITCQEYVKNPVLIKEGILKFKSLSHRLEYLGEYADIHFYNDSIATIPEATIEAIKSIGDVDTLILGGFDRGIDYQNLADFILDSELKNVLFMGPAGQRIRQLIESKNQYKISLFTCNKMEDCFKIISEKTQKEKACLLSPAAASYDIYKDFQDRGNHYKKLARNL